MACEAEYDDISVEVCGERSRKPRVKPSQARIARHYQHVLLCIQWAAAQYFVHATHSALHEVG